MAARTANTTGGAVATPRTGGSWWGILPKAAGQHSSPYHLQVQRISVLMAGGFFFLLIGCEQGNDVTPRHAPVGSGSAVTSPEGSGTTNAASAADTENVEPLLVALAATDAAFAAANSGDTSRALEQWGKAAAMYEGMSGKEADRASCLLNRGLVLAALGRHEQAVAELEEAKSILEPIGHRGKTSYMVQAVLHREQTILNMVERLRQTDETVASRTSAVRPQVLLLAQTLLEDYAFRKSFLMDKASPVTFPNQVKNALGLDEQELSGVCQYAFGVHTNYHELLKQKHTLYLGATFDLSPGFLAALRTTAEGDTELAIILEKELGSVPILSGESE